MSEESSANQPGNVEAGTVNMNQAGAMRIAASTVTIKQGGAAMVKSDTFTVQQGGMLVGQAQQANLTTSRAGAVVAGQDANMSMSGANVLVSGRDVKMENSGTFLMVTGRDVSMQNSGTLLLFTRQVNGTVNTAFGPRESVIFGAVAGVVMGLVLVFMPRRKRKK